MTFHVNDLSKLQKQKQSRAAGMAAGSRRTAVGTTPGSLGDAMFGTRGKAAAARANGAPATPQPPLYDAYARAVRGEGAAPTGQADRRTAIGTTPGSLGDAMFGTRGKAAARRDIRQLTSLPDFAPGDSRERAAAGKRAADVAEVNRLTSLPDFAPGDSRERAAQAAPAGDFQRQLRDMQEGVRDRQQQSELTDPRESWIQTADGLTAGIREKVSRDVEGFRNPVAKALRGAGSAIGYAVDKTGDAIGNTLGEAVAGPLHESYYDEAGRPPPSESTLGEALAGGRPPAAEPKAPPAAEAPPAAPVGVPTSASDPRTGTDNGGAITGRFVARDMQDRVSGVGITGAGGGTGNIEVAPGGRLSQNFQRALEGKGGGSFNVLGNADTRAQFEEAAKIRATVDQRRAARRGDLRESQLRRRANQNISLDQGLGGFLNAAANRNQARDELSRLDAYNLAGAKETQANQRKAAELSISASNNATKEGRENRKLRGEEQARQLEQLGAIAEPEGISATNILNFAKGNLSAINTAIQQNGGDESQLIPERYEDWTVQHMATLARLAADKAEKAKQ